MTWKQPVAFALTLFPKIHPDAQRPTNANSYLLLTTDGPDIKASHVHSHMRENCDWVVLPCRWPNNSRPFEGSQFLSVVESSSQAVKQSKHMKKQEYAST